MDRGDERSRVPGRGTLARECRPCAITLLVAHGGPGNAPPYVVEDADEDVVVISGPELGGIVVIPRQHVGSLEELPLAQRARVLAVLRRVTRSVQGMNPGADTRVFVRTDPPASADHVCFQVVPNGFEDPVRSGSSRL